MPHEGDVAVEEAENESRVVSGMEERELAETEAGWDVCQQLVVGDEVTGGCPQPGNKVQLVARAVVDPCPVPETLHEIPSHLFRRRIPGQSQFLVPSRCPLRYSVIEAYKRLVPEPTCSLLGRVFIDELVHFFKDSQELLDKRGDLAWVRVRQIEDRVPEVGYECNDELVGGGGTVEGEVVDRCELFGGKGEGYGGEGGWWGRGGGDAGGRLGGTVERGRHLSVGLASCSDEVRWVASTWTERACLVMAAAPRAGSSEP